MENQENNVPLQDWFASEDANEAAELINECIDNDSAVMLGNTFWRP